MNKNSRNAVVPLDEGGMQPCEIELSAVTLSKMGTNTKDLMKANLEKLIQESHSGNETSQRILSRVSG